MAELQFVEPREHPDLANIEGVEILYKHTVFSIDRYHELIDTIQNGFFRIAAFEEGGGSTTKGFAKIICGIKGERLKPRLIFKTGRLSNSRHAIFCEHSLIEVTISKQGNIYNCSITAFETENEKLLEECIWKGTIEAVKEIPSYILKKYRRAVEAGFHKVNCFHCREPHYYFEEGGVRREDGICYYCMLNESCNDADPKQRIEEGCDYFKTNWSSFLGEDWKQQLANKTALGIAKHIIRILQQKHFRDNEIHKVLELFTYIPEPKGGE